MLRQEVPADVPAVYRVNRAAFERADEAELVDRLRTNAEAFLPELSLVAELEGRVMGHILFTRCWIEGPADSSVAALALAPMAVLPQLQGQGIGGRLVRAGLDRARDLGFRSVIVLGHARYYPRFGFVRAEKWGIRPSFEVPAGHYMALELVPGALASVSGTVRYAPQFGIG